MRLFLFSLLILLFTFVNLSFAQSQPREVGHEVGIYKSQTSTPSTPNTGKSKVYVKDNDLKILNEEGVERTVGSLSVSSTEQVGNLGLSTSVASNALTISLKGQNGSNPSSLNIVQVAFRSSTESSGTFTTRNISAPTSLTISSGSTLGHQNGQTRYIYVYAIDNSGIVELAVSTTQYLDNSIVSTVAESGVGAADSASSIYSSVARSNVPIRKIARLKVNQSTAGLWVSSISQIKLGSEDSYRYVSCVLRYTAGAWECLNGSGHTPIGVSSVTTNTTYATLNYNFTATNVISFLVVPDETFAVRGISAGASAGLSSAAIEFSRVASDISGLIQYNGSAWTCTGCTGNLSVGSFSGGGVLTLNHDAASDYSVSVSSLGGTYVPILGSLTSTTTSIAWPATYGGSYVSTPNTNLKAYFSRKTNGYGVKILSSSDLEIESGNFFVYGIFEE